MNKKKRYPLPKRFSVAMTEQAYSRLRQINAQTGLGNNYILTVLLERLDELTDQETLAQIFDDFIEEYGSPAAAKMEGNKNG